MSKPEPGLYPRGGPRPSLSPAEVKVYEALRRHLHEGWYAWHSLSVFTNDRDETEADFVIAGPRRGMLVRNKEEPPGMMVSIGEDWPPGSRG